jgi:GrpB-like predicted nucleotidyltransferase (UPF0157 family)
MAAKPVIDILLIVSELRELDTRDTAMIQIGYEPKGELGIAGRRLYVKGGDSSRTHHVHAYASGHKEIETHRNFRDFLRSHPEQASRYAELKLRLAKEHPNNIEEYMAGKSPFIVEILKLAQAWQSGANLGRPNRDRGEPCGSPLPHHLTCGSASGGST